MTFRLFLTVLFVSALASAAAPQSRFLTDLIAAAEAKIKAAPQNPEGFADLAFALARRARETEDPACYKKAEEAVAAALKLNPGNFEARKARVMVRLQQGRYADAEEEGKALSKQIPDDNLMYGLLADAALAQGKYSEAETLSQRMLDLRQVNGPGLQRAARVREAIGFPDGAIEFWNSAFRLASASDVEERAYILTELAGLSRRRAKLPEALHYAAGALALEPDYPAALLEQARISLQQNKPDAAMQALGERLKQAPSISAQYWMAAALEAAGKTAEASAAGERFLTMALAPDAPRGRGALLLRYWTARGQAAQAVRFAKENLSREADQQFLNAYALALLASGNPSEAQAQIEKSLAPGVLDPALFLDAAHIARANHRKDAAEIYLKKCIEANANSDFAQTALRELLTLAQN